MILLTGDMKTEFCAGAPNITQDASISTYPEPHLPREVTSPVTSEAMTTSARAAEQVFPMSYASDVSMGVHAHRSQVQSRIMHLLEHISCTADEAWGTHLTLIIAVRLP